MLQFLQFDRARVSGAEISLISGKNAVKFFTKRSVYLVLFIYATLFLAVATPFVTTPSIPIYIAGSIATAVYIARFTNHIIKYLRFRGGHIQIGENEVILKGSDFTTRVPAASISLFQVNVLGNFVIQQRNGESLSFPASLLSKEDRDRLLDQAKDMAPDRTGLLRKMWEFVDAITVALVLAVHIIQFIVQAYYIPSGSMEDTLQIKDRLFVEKITYGPTIPKMLGMEKPLHLSFLGIRDVKKGDIVIFKPPHDEEKDYIKRCVAVAGDHVAIQNGALYINGKKREEPFVKGITTVEEKNRILGVVPRGHIVVFGDNRQNSLDSRIFGYLSLERITGRAFILYWATNDIMKRDFSRFGLIR